MQPLSDVLGQRRSFQKHSGHFEKTVREKESEHGLKILGLVSRNVTQRNPEARGDVLSQPLFQEKFNRWSERWLCNQPRTAIPHHSVLIPREFVDDRKQPRRAVRVLAAASDETDASAAHGFLDETQCIRGLISLDPHHTGQIREVGIVWIGGHPQLQQFLGLRKISLAQKADDEVAKDQCRQRGFESRRTREFLQAFEARARFPSFYEQSQMQTRPWLANLLESSPGFAGNRGRSLQSPTLVQMLAGGRRCKRPRLEADKVCARNSRQVHGYVRYAARREEQGSTNVHRLPV